MNRNVHAPLAKNEMAEVEQIAKDIDKDTKKMIEKEIKRLYRRKKR